MDLLIKVTSERAIETAEKMQACMADLNKVSDEMADLIKIIHESLDDEEKEIYQEYNLAKEKTQALYGMVDEFTNELIEALSIYVWPKTDYDTTVTTPGDVIV